MERNKSFYFYPKLYTSVLVIVIYGRGLVKLLATKPDLLAFYGLCRSRSDCTDVQSDLDLHCPIRRYFPHSMNLEMLDRGIYYTHKIFSQVIQ